MVYRPAAGRPELPGRAPLVPEHASLQPAPCPGDRAPVLRRPLDPVHRDLAVRVVRDGAAAPPRPRCPPAARGGVGSRGSSTGSQRRPPAAGVAALPAIPARLASG